MNHKSRVHFIGIGGIGMSALTRWFLAQKWAVSGSDISRSSITQELQKEGVKVKIGHKKANVPENTAMVVYTSALKTSNPELREARRKGLKPLSYSEAIGCLTRAYQTLAVAGSHGKSTTAAMIGLTLVKAGLDPNVVLGTKLKEFGGKNFRAGQSKLLVLEADEWNGAFWNYLPYAAVVTNIDKEHLDFYKNLSRIKKSFLKFLSNTRENGFLVLNRDDKNLYSLRSPISQIAKRKSLRVSWYSISNSHHSYTFADLRRVIKIPGQHNISNALAAFTLATKVLKIKKSIALRALAAYRGAWRRMEYRGKWQIAYRKSHIARKEKTHKPFAIRSMLVYDDYAHHPTEIKATLKAFREKFPKRKIICVYQPHQAKRLEALWSDFQGAFTDADILILLPTYEVAGRDRAGSKFTSEKLAAAIQRKYPRKQIFYLSNPKNLRRAISASLFYQRKSASDLRKSAILIMMGAGDIVNYTPLLLRKSSG